MIDVLNDEYYMRLALELAAKAAGQTDINPVVGCVIVKDGRIVGIGTHLKRGEGHAEVHALQMAGEQANGATVYVTLEPCSHYGQTSPCCERIIAMKVAKVVIAAKDPNPEVAGRGIARMRECGIEVVIGTLEIQSQLLNEKFIKYITTRLPFVTLKTASTLDGRIASSIGDSRWITGAAAREQVHALRHRHQAIMVGIQTILADDPLLTTRAEVPALHPVKIIVDSRLRLPLNAKVVTNRTARTIVLTTEQASEESRVQLEQAGVEIITCGTGPAVDLSVAMKQLGQQDIGSILLEGGGRLNGAMLKAGLIDKVILYYAAKIIGGSAAPSTFSFEGLERMSDAIKLERVEVATVGEDICVSGYPVYANELS